jgi:hypothetical protein
MSKTVIDLGRDLPVRAAPLTESALVKIFGGLPRYYCGAEGTVCGFGLTQTGCCEGLACRVTQAYGGLAAPRCVPA